MAKTTVTLVAESSGLVVKGVSELVSPAGGERRQINERGFLIRAECL